MSYFSSSPFSFVASEQSAGCWSGQPDVLERLDRVHRTWLRRADSSIDIIWAKLGAGKSHALFHLQYLVQESETEDICVYVEFPEQTRNFRDLYLRILREIPPKVIATAVTESLEDLHPDLVKAAPVLLNGGYDERSVVEAWLRGGNPHLRELRHVSGIDRRIENDSLATDILCSIVKALAASGKRLIILLDEFQRIEVLRGRKDAVLSCLRSVFSQCPDRFSVVMSIMSVAQETVASIVPNELKTLCGRADISIPEMDIDEAIEWVLGRFEYFRPAEFSGSAAAPFTEDALRAILEFVKNEQANPLIPRQILQGLVSVSDEVMHNGPIEAVEAIEIITALNQ